ncbi:hypothetical protein AB0M28_31060 [Streptomyces sp. NPDC051940]|uniref:hypothetical protein n=1 Tax=Streptomyces sp. NPDC051940 TaxID=3155675 RepID=UPI003417C189
MTGDIWLGDLVRAARSTGARTAADHARIAALLGLGPAGPAPGAALTPAGARRGLRPERSPGPAGAAGGLPPDPAPAAVPGDGSRPQPADGVQVLQAVGRAAAHPGSWRSDPLPVAAAVGSEPPHLPLLAPRSTAAVLHAALSRTRPEGEPDVEAAAHRIARGRPVAHIPRRPLPTLRYGVQILADVSASMEPFARDVHDVIAAVQAVAGPARTRVRWFSDVPGRGAGDGQRATWGPYRPPQPGTQVLILSDLGAGGPFLNPWRAAPAEWRLTVRQIQQAGCRAVAFVPLPRHRWPHWIRGVLPAVVWDRGTTVGQVLEARR